MKKTVTLVSLSLLLATPAFARQYGMAGCGLGSVLFGTGGSQTSAVTTNGATGTQLFGITSGTSNCTADSEDIAVLKQESFVIANYQTLSKEMAQGQGATVVGLAAALGCHSSSVPQFGKFLQSRYHEIIAAPGSLAMLDTLKARMATEPTLSNACPLSQVY